MRLKRLIIFFIILSMLVTSLTLTAVAQSVYKFAASEYSSYSGYMNTEPSGKPLPSLGMGNNTALTYNSVYVEEDGTYKLDAEFVGVYGEDSNIEVYIDEVMLIKASLSTTQTELSATLGYIPLKKGNNTLTFKVRDTESVYFTNFSLERVGALTTFVRNGNSADSQSEEGITDNKPSEGMNSNSFSEYVIEISEDGYYAFNFEGAALSNVNAEVLLTVDSEQTQSLTLNGKGWDNPVWKNYGATCLKSGTHTFRLQIESEAIRLFGIIIKGIEEATANEFLSEVKNANVKSLDLIFEKYDDKLINSYKTLTNNFIYKDFCYMRILGIETDDFAHFDKMAMYYIKEENQFPLVYISQNNEKVTSIPNGDFALVFSERIDKPLSAVAALFDKERNQLESIRITDIIPNKENVFSGFCADGDEELRIIFFNDKEKLQIGDLPVDDYYFYVSTSGNDDADGSLESPVKTVEEAVMRVRELSNSKDATVSLLPGEYYVDDTIKLTEKDGGNENNKITYKSFDENNPAVISGGKTVSGWTPYKDGIYVAQTEEIADVRQFYINGLPATRARGDSVFYAYSYWDDEKTEYEQDGFMLESTTFPSLTKPQDAEICYNILWTVQRLPVKDITETNGTFTVKMDQPYYSQAVTMLCEGGVQPVIGMQFFIENDISLLDEEGEFYFDKESKMIYYYPFAQEKLEEADCVVSVTEGLIDIKGSSPEQKIKNLSFENIDFRYGAYISVNTTGTVSFQAECLATNMLNTNPAHAEQANRLQGQITLENAENISFKNCDISCMGSSALVLRSNVENSIVEGCFFRDNGGSAISVGEYNYTDDTLPENTAKNIKIENSVITRPGIDFMFCPAISVYYAKGIQILHNTIQDTPYSGISLGWGWGSSVSESVECQDHIIKGNKIKNISNAVRDGGHIYLLGGLNNTIVSENFISESDDFGGIYFDSGSKGITVENNVSEKCKNWLFGGGSSSNVLVKENYTDGSEADFEANTEKNVIAADSVIYDNSLWEGKALEVYENSGAAREREWNNEILPDWRINSLFNVPRTEELKSGEMLIEAEDYTGFTTNSTKTEPTLSLQGYRTVIGDIRQFDVMDYEVYAIAEGEYIFELRYTTGPYSEQDSVVAVNIMVNDEASLSNCVLPNTNTKWASVIPYKVGTVYLKEGKNRVSIKSLRNGFSYDNFKLIAQ